MFVISELFIFFFAAGKLLRSGGVIRTPDEKVGEEPLFEGFRGTLGKRSKTDASAARVVAPDDLASAMDETAGFGKIEAKGQSAMRFKALARLNGETFFVQVDEFAEIDNESGLRTIEAGVDRGMESLANATAPVFP